MMDNLLQKIRKAEREEIGELVKAALDRYRELYPDWEMHFLSIDKRQDRAEQIERILALLDALKEQN